MNKLKLSVFGLLVSGVVAFSAIAGVSLAKTAYAADGATTTAKFVMKDGGSVRVAKDETDKTGIRWTAIINEEYYNSLNVGEQTVEFGALVTPARNLGENELITEDSKQVMAVPCQATEPTFNGDGEFIFNASIVYDDLKDLKEDQKQAAYALELVARAYVKVGEKYNFVDTYSTTRSMRAIALAAVQSGEYAEETLNGYYGKKTVNIATENTGYYGNVDESSVLENKHNISGDIQAYIGAKPVSATITGEGIVVTNAGELEEEKSYTLNVFGADGNVYSQPFVAATKVIRTAADLAYFELKDITVELGKSITTNSVYGGYYVVAKDIDATGYTHQAVTDTKLNTTLNSAVDGRMDYISVVTGGFTGIFDGAGHTISNLTVKDQGLFGLISEGTVKNIGFTNVSLVGSAYRKNIALFAQNVYAGQFENVFVQANTLYGGDQQQVQGATNPLAGDARGHRALVASSVTSRSDESKVTSFKNCVFKYDVENTNIRYCFSYGLFGNEVYFSNNNKTDNRVSKFENVYVISNKTISTECRSAILQAGNSHIVLAENEVSEGESELEVALKLYQGCFFNGAKAEYSDDGIYTDRNGKYNIVYEENANNTFNVNYIRTAKGVKRYATAEDMNAAGNDYTSFSSAYWSISEDGVLSWKA